MGRGDKRGGGERGRKMREEEEEEDILIGWGWLELEDPWSSEKSKGNSY